MRSNAPSVRLRVLTLTSALILALSVHTGCSKKTTPPDASKAKDDAKAASGKGANAKGAKDAKPGAKPGAKQRHANPTQVVDLELAHSNTFARLAGGGVRAWGQGQHGQLGTGKLPKFYGADLTLNAATPVQVPDAKHVVFLAAGQSATGASGSTVCAGVRNGSVICWGDERLIPSTSAKREQAKPLVVAALKHAKKIDFGIGHACAILRDDTVACWGNNNDGQLGSPRPKSSRDLVAVPGLKDVVDIALGPSHSCAATKKGDVYCWGRNRNKTITPKDNDPKITQPARIDGVSKIVKLAANDAMSCGLDASSDLYCWGRNVKRGRSKLAQQVQHVDGGYAHMCAVKKDTTLHCWGTNKHGQLGTGTTTRANTPTQVAGLKDIVDVSAGYEHTCAVKRTGDVLCWGRNRFGELGNGTVIDALKPMPVNGASAAKLPPLSHGFGAKNVADTGVAQSFKDLPPRCTYSPKLELKSGLLHRSPFKVASAYAKRGRDGGLTIKLANYNMRDAKNAPIWPRGDQFQVLVNLKHLEDPNAKPPKTRDVVVGAYLREDKSAKQLSPFGTGFANAQNSGFALKSDRSKVTLTHLDERWACGTLDLQGDYGTVKGAFAAEIVNRK